MNLERLKEAEAAFLATYPGGFNHPDMLALGKKHKVDKLVSEAQEAFAPAAFDQPRQLSESMVRLIGRSSMVSMFEKPKFRDHVRSLGDAETEALSESLREQLHGDQAAGFEQMVELLGEAKLAKWSLLTILPTYFRPLQEVFIKPTTAKGVIAQFELEGVEYKPRPSWAFYSRYRDYINQMRATVDPCIAPNNAAFCGFLMMSAKT